MAMRSKITWIECGARIGNGSNAPETYLVDGKQHVLFAVGDTLYAFTLYNSGRHS